MSFVSQILRRASIAERSNRPALEKAETYTKLADEAATIAERMTASMSRLSPKDLADLGPTRQKEINQLTEMMSRLRTKARQLTPN